MNKDLIALVKSNTCYILDCHPDVEEEWKKAGVPKEHVQKLTEAFDLIFQLNEKMCELEKEIKDKECKRCDGTGLIDNLRDTCDVCNGTGEKKA